MAYSSGGLIEAADYNGFVTNNANNVNQVWSTGTGDLGWGQTALSSVSVGGTVTATSWASLVNTLASMGNQTNTTITSRTAPVTGNTISILANVQTDINNVKTNRGNASGLSSQNQTFTGTVSKTAATAQNAAGWTITFTSTVTFPSADQARYFWNAGGIVSIDMSKTSTGTDKDPDWNTFVGSTGQFYMTGRVNSANQIIAGGTYTGFSNFNRTGPVPSPNLTTTGWYSLTAGAAATTMWQMNSATSPYTGDYIRITAAVNAGRTALTLVTTWVDGGYSGAGKNNAISGGTATNSPFSSFGTAPTVLVRYFAPSTTYLTNSWGTPAVSSSVA